MMLYTGSGLHAPLHAVCKLKTCCWSSMHLLYDTKRKLRLHWVVHLGKEGKSMLLGMHTGSSLYPDASETCS